MARKKRTAEARFAEVVEELGIEKSQAYLDLVKRFYFDKKSPETDPNLKAEERTNEPTDNTPTTG